MDRLEKVSEEVFISRHPIVRWGSEEIAFLKQQVLLAPRGRTRVCAHKSSSDSLHEMLIALRSGFYIQPHKHPAKNESFHVIEGVADVVIFTDSGEVSEVVHLGPADGTRPFFYRLPKNLFHTVIVRSELLIVHETTDGPFEASQTYPAPFAPDPAQCLEVRDYLKHLSTKLGESCPMF